MTGANPIESILDVVELVDIAAIETTVGAIRYTSPEPASQGGSRLPGFVGVHGAAGEKPRREQMAGAYGRTLSPGVILTPTPRRGRRRAKGDTSRLLRGATLSFRVVAQ
jgi:hypothetical protein